MLETQVSEYTLSPPAVTIVCTWVELQLPVEGVENCNHSNSQTIYRTHVCLNDGCVFVPIAAIDFGTQLCSATLQRLAKGLAHGLANLISVPVWSSV